jgi:hypothetical protein
MNDAKASLELGQRPGHYAWPAASTVDAGFASTDLEEDGASAWPATIGGLIAATALACLLCRLPAAHSLSRFALWLASAGYVTASALAGAVAAWCVSSILGTKPPLPGESFLPTVSVAFVWLPALALLYRENSPWLIAAMALSSVITATCLRTDVFPSRPVPPTQETERGLRDVMTFVEVQPRGFRPWFSLSASICMQAALLSWLAGDRLVAGSLLAACCSMLAWRWTHKPAENRRGSRSKVLRLVLFAFLAILFTSAALAPFLRSGAFAGGSRAYPASGRPGTSGKETVAATQDTSYQGIILWTVPPRKKEIAAPSPKKRLLGAGRITKPVTIPFDGVYWYFKKPDTRPHRGAHVVHGTPTAVDIHSLDWHPLLMEAHQKLATRIPLSCCSELQVAIENADNRPGSIALGVILKDSDSPGSPVLSLGTAVVVSSERGHVSLNRRPVDETLRFTIPARPRIREFNEITVLFLPARERSLGGAQIAIQHFVLIPARF